MEEIDGVNSALSIIFFTCSSVLLYTNVITHSRCLFVFGLNAILFEVSHHMMSSMLEMERLSPCQENAPINVTLGHRVLFHMLQFHE